MFGHRASTTPAAPDPTHAQSELESIMRSADSRRRSSIPRDLLQNVQDRLGRQKKKPPLCWSIAQRVYHKYGLKHVCLLLVLVLYGFFGALVFVLIEGPAEERLKAEWRSRMDDGREEFVRELMIELFNNSRYVVFLPAWKTKPIVEHLSTRLEDFERTLGVTFDPQHKISWDYWNAVLFTGTICTTIGYGHIYPRTPAGRVLTCIYALFGIPLVLTVLNDLGKLLTVGLKFPWFQTKRAWRRLVRLCTHTPMEKILDVEKRERDNLAIFDLPIPVAVGLIIGWIFLCSATFLMWEKRWTYLEAFYFFFISLSTVGLGDIHPEQPRYLLMMFGYIIIGLSLVSMSVNLIQMKLEKTYHGGGSFRHDHRRPAVIDFDEEPAESRPLISPTIRATLGVLQSTTTTAPHEPHPAAIESTSSHHPASKSRGTQTLLSFPVTRQAIVTREGDQNVVRLLKPKQRSLTNLWQPQPREQHDIIRSALANVSDAAAVIIFVGERGRDSAEFLLGDRAFNYPLVTTGQYSSIRTLDGMVMEVDANRNESVASVSIADV